MKLKFSANTINFIKVFLVFLVFSMGLFLRLKLFPTNNAWLGDIGRDMLAGHLIAFKGMSTQVGHFNSGIDFFYPSFYYYFIAFLTILGGDSYINIANILILYQSAGIILVFFIVKKSFSYLPALIISVFYAFSERFINFSLTPISAYNSIPILLTSVLFLQIHFKKRSLPALAVSSFLLVLASTFYYGAVLLIPLYGLLLLTKKIRHKSKQEHISSLLIFGLSTTLFFTAFYGPIVRWEHFQEKLISSGFERLEIHRVFSNDFFSKNYAQFKTMHSNLTVFSLVLYLLIIIFSLLQKSSRKITGVFLFIILMHAALYAGHKDSLGHYYIYIYLLLLFILSSGLEFILQKNKFLFVVFSVAILISGNCFNSRIQNSSNISYDHHKRASEIVAVKFPHSSIIYNVDCSRLKNINYDWESRSFWYFQREANYFILNDFNSQIELNNKNTIFLCSLSENYVLTEAPIFQFNLDSKKYMVFI